MLIKSCGEIPYIRLKDAVTVVNHCNFLDCSTEIYKDGLYLEININNSRNTHRLKVNSINGEDVINLLELTRIIQNVNYSKGYKQGLSTVQL